MNYDYFRQNIQLALCTPIKWVAVYMLANIETTDGTGSKNSKTAAWKNVIDFAHFVMGKVLRLRTRPIYGTFYLPTHKSYQLEWGFCLLNVISSSTHTPDPLALFFSFRCPSSVPCM